MVTMESVERFLGGRRVAVVGASDGKDNFGGTIYRELRSHGYEVVAVNPHADRVAGDPCVPDLASVPAPPVDGAVLVVHPDIAVEAVRACIDLGIPRVWLFKGIGGAGAVSDEVVRLCEDNGIDVVAGACPLMFLEPVGWFHRVHRATRRLNGSLVARAA